MNPYLSLTNGFTLPEISGGRASNFSEIANWDTPGATFSYSATPVDIKLMNPTESLMYNTGRTINPTVGNGEVVNRYAQNTSLPKNPYATDPMQVLSANNALPAKYTQEQVAMYTTSAQYGVQAASYFANAFLAGNKYAMKKSQYNFLADQYERSADLLEANMREITRAAYADANVYKMQGAQTKAKQKTSQAATGFAVGKGVYGTMLDTTDARINYNVAMVMLKSELQNAEIVRKAGAYRARAEIEKGNANIAEIEKKNAVLTNVIGGIGAAINSGFSFYVGKYGLEGSGSAGVKASTGPGGQKSYSVGGTPMYGRG